ncbi:MAG TPA: hypothetical protein VHO01_06270 [Jatrophihabitans sp.]|nr:hypothetical protein [Jatrophihabitans sp.]
MASEPATRFVAADVATVAAAPTWDQVLAELETETALLAEGLRRGELLSPVKPWHPPVMPPIPVELVARAQTLLDQQHRLQAQLASQLAQAPAATRQRSPHAELPIPLLLDLRA